MKRLEEISLHQALVHAADGALAAGPDRRILFWNRAAERLLGYSPAEVIGRTCCEVLERSPQCQLKAAREAGAEGGAFEMTARTRRGEAVQLSVSTLVVPPRNGEGPVTVHLFREARKSAPAVAAETDALAGTLTRREIEVLRLLAEGCNTRAAAQRLGVSPATVRNHVQNLLGKLGVHSRLQAVAYANRRGLLTHAG
ncbi:MAG TPA: LuxR C-terminal-related transcriptional regulator [Candidatus Binatia bacterium]|nr:LuxR C-terminal-related transcriptional regulator [Candidatus Binatia bacterium]